MSHSVKIIKEHQNGFTFPDLIAVALDEGYRIHSMVNNDGALTAVMIKYPEDKYP